MESEENNPLVQFIDFAISNYNNLKENEKEVLRNMEGTPQADVLRKVLGPELGSAFNFVERPDKTMDAIPTDVPRQPERVEQDIPMPRAMEESRGLAIR